MHTTLFDLLESMSSLLSVRQHLPPTMAFFNLDSMSLLGSLLSFAWFTFFNSDNLSFNSDTVSLLLKTRYIVCPDTDVTFANPSCFLIPRLNKLESRLLRLAATSQYFGDVTSAIWLMDTLYFFSFSAPSRPIRRSVR